MRVFVRHCRKQKPHGGEMFHCSFWQRVHSSTLRGLCGKKLYVLKMLSVNNFTLKKIFKIQTY